MGIGKSFFCAANAWSPGIDAPIDAPIPESDGTVRIRERPLAAKFEQTTFLPELGCENSFVEIVSIDASIVDRSAKEEF